MSQSETLILGSALGLSPRDVLDIVLMGAVTSILFSPLAVLILGKMLRPRAWIGTRHTPRATARE